MLLEKEILGVDSAAEFIYSANPGFVGGIWRVSCFMLGVKSQWLGSYNVY